MDDNKKLRDMIETGKGNLQWERDIPASALANLQQLAQKDFRFINTFEILSFRKVFELLRGNLGQIIHDLYQTAHIMFSDMPQVY